MGTWIKYPEKLKALGFNPEHTKISPKPSKIISPKPSKSKIEPSSPEPVTDFPDDFHLRIGDIVADDVLHENELGTIVSVQSMQYTVGVRFSDGEIEIYPEHGVVKKPKKSTRRRLNLRSPLLKRFSRASRR